MGRVVQRRAIAAGQLLLDLLVGARCAGCGSSATPTPCADCTRALDAAPAAVHAGWVGEGPARRLVVAAKLGTWRGGAAWFADRLVERLTLVDIDVVTWVPADRRRRSRRGGCLPERCARRLAKRLDVPAIALLCRVQGRSQRGLDRERRLTNVGRSFRVRPRSLASLPRASRVLLLDDVRATGATLAATRRELERAGLHVQSVALLAARASHPAAGAGARPVSTPGTGLADTPHGANCRSRQAPLVPIRWGDVRRKGSTRT